MKYYILLLLLIVSTQAFQKDIESDQLKRFREQFLQSSQSIEEVWSGDYIVKTLVHDNKNRYVSGRIEYNGQLDNFMSDDNPVIKKVSFYIRYDGDEEVTVKLFRNEGPYFELPNKAPFPHEKSEGSKNKQYTVDIPYLNEKFEITIASLEGAVIFSNKGQPLILTQKYNQFGTQVFGERIWGWGERFSQWGYTQTGNYTIWNQDNSSTSNGKEGTQSYGTHPVVFQMTSMNQQNQKLKQGQFSLMYLKSSYGMVMEYNQNESIVYRMSGGPVFLKFFIYSSPKENLRAYSKYANGWQMIPFWSLGFHICRYGIPDSAAWQEIWETANKDGIAYDVQWSDIDYLLDYQDFTIKPEYDVTVMKEVTDISKPDGVRWIPIIDAGVGAEGDSGQKGLINNLYIMSAVYNKALIGCVWPGAAYFMDWNKPGAKEFWIEGLQNITEVYQGPQPSGIWLDMNDPSNFVNGEVEKYSQCPAHNSVKQSESGNDWGYPWSPNGDEPLDHKTLSTTGKHYNEEDSVYVYAALDFNITEYELHDYYNFFEQIATNEYLKASGFQLPFIISRSTVPGSGAYAQHWTGDNTSTWDQLLTTFGDLFNFQIFGIPIVGADVCGFHGNATPEICARWYQAGAWYPFFRTHNDKNSVNQYPWSFPNDPYVLESSRSAINLRYDLLKWYYSQLLEHNPHGTFFNPLWFDFPEEEMSLNEAHQVLISDTLMVTPVLTQGDSTTNTTDIKVYFPGVDRNLIWYGMTSNTAKTGGFKAGTVGSFTIPFNDVSPYFMKGGKLLVYQYKNTALRSRLLDQNFSVRVALDQDNQAQGRFAGISEYDDTTIISQCIDQQNCLVDIIVEIIQSQGKNVLKMQVQNKNDKTVFSGSFTVQEVEVLEGKTLSNLAWEFNSKNTVYQADY